MPFPRRWLFLVPIIFVLVAAVQLHGHGTFRTPASAPAAPYCLAVRGNGDAMPAHWGAMAQAIETFGVPTAVAGGSSASISAFLLESVLLHPGVAGAEKELRAAFLVKSFQGFFYGLGDRPGWKDLAALYRLAKNDPKHTELEALLRSLTQDSLSHRTKDVIHALEQIMESKVLYGPGVERLYRDALAFEKTKSRLHFLRLEASAREVQKSFSVLGDFDAKNDSALLLREGVVNFEALAHLVGRMGDFYALKNASPATLNAAERYLRQCAPGTEGKTWVAITNKNPGCQTDLEALTTLYFADTEGQEFRVKETVGAHLPALVADAFLPLPAAAALKARKEKYLADHDPADGEDLPIDPKDISFGYFGQTADLAKVSANLDKDALDKSHRFSAFGPAPWATALSVSPAEPGLASFRDFSANGQTFTSLGGWADLHPMPVLRALGCETVVYLTRVGGDTLFGQGVAKRLFHLDEISWSRLDPKSKGAKAGNANGDPADQTSQWSRMYNLANPKSSYAASLALADAVVCTHWDDFDSKTQFTPLIEESYAAPIYFGPGWRNPTRREPRRITAAENGVDPALGYRPYAGCIPF